MSLLAARLWAHQQLGFYQTIKTSMDLVLVVERDPTYENSSTMHTNSCMRQQFSTELNVRISQFAADFVKNIRDYMDADDLVPELSIQNFGYMYLADTEGFADILRESQKVQLRAGRCWDSAFKSPPHQTKISVL